jgi:hypothetical protein
VAVSRSARPAGGTARRGGPVRHAAGDRQGAPDGADSTVQAQLGHGHDIGRRLGWQLAGGRKEAERDGEIECGAVLPRVGGGELKASKTSG